MFDKAHRLLYHRAIGQRVVDIRVWLGRQRVGVAMTPTRSYEPIVAHLQNEIRGGRLSLGQRLPTERELGEQFGVSRAVVREAIKVLDTMGLVESRQGSGIYVRKNTIPKISHAITLSVTPEDDSVLRLLELREALEALTARYAAERGSQTQRETIAAAALATVEAAQAEDVAAFGGADAQFHTAVYEAAGNQYLSAVARAVHHMQIGVAELLARHPGSLLLAAGQHMSVATAVVAGEAQAAGEAMAAHVRYSRDVLRAILDAQVVQEVAE